MAAATGKDRAAKAAGRSLPDPVLAALAALDAHKGEEIVVLDMRGVAGFTDTMVICTGRSHPHTQALAEAVEDRLRQDDIKAAHVEGRADGNWILLDYLDLIVHVFTPESRQFYQLEKLWRDAPMLEWGRDSAVDR